MLWKLQMYKADEPYNEGMEKIIEGKLRVVVVVVCFYSHPKETIANN